MNNLIYPLQLEIYKYLDIYSLIRIYKIQLIDNFNENQKKAFYKIIWKCVKRNLKYYEKKHKPWKYDKMFDRFIYYFPAYNKVVPVYIEPINWIKMFLLR